MAQNEPARATIEVDLSRSAMGDDVQYLAEGKWLVVRDCHNAKPLGPAAEAMLNPKNELEEIAKRLRDENFGLTANSVWGELPEEIKETWYRVAREVCRMKAEELNNLGCGGCNCPVCRRGRKRIAELEEMAKGG